MYNIEIDSESGFCFGVTTAIKKAEEELEAAMKQDAAGEIKTEDSPSPQAEDTISD